MYSIAVFDDNDARREGLKFLIEATPNMTCVGLYPDCRGIDFRFKLNQPDVALMDINMPNVNGIEGLKYIKEHFPEVKVIMQTIFEDEDKILEAISAGADGYIIKQSSPQKLIEGINEVMSGGAAMTPSVAMKVLKLFTTGKRKIVNSDVSLTPREQEILNLLVDGYTYNMIGKELFISYSTVNKHITNIYAKLQVSSVSAAVSKAIKEDLV